MENSIAASPTYRIFRDKHGIPQFEPKRGTQALKDALIYSFPALETELQLMQAALRKFFDTEKGSKFVFELPERDLQTSLARDRDISVVPVQPGKAGLRSWKLSRASRAPSRPSSRASSRAPSRASSRARSRASSRAETPTPFQELTVPVAGGGTMTTWMLSNGQELEKRKRQPYDPVKRRKVAENRGNACEKHRASKTACNPSECPQNKLYSKLGGVGRRESMSSTYDSPSGIAVLPTIEQATATAVVSATSTNNQPLEDAPSETDGNPSGMTVQQQPNHSPDEFDISILSLDYAYTDMDSSMWSESVDATDISWSSSAPNEYHPVILESSAELDLIHSMGDLSANFRPPVSNLPLEQISDDQLHSSEQSAPYHVPASTTVGNNLSFLGSGQHKECEDQKSGTPEDPFMGWASKRASHLIDEYGWVLSHVEAL